MTAENKPNFETAKKFIKAAIAAAPTLAMLLNASPAEACGFKGAIGDFVNQLNISNPGLVGNCLDDEFRNPFNTNEVEQHTTGANNGTTVAKLVWRESDGLTALVLQSPLESVVRTSPTTAALQAGDIFPDVPFSGGVITTTTGQIISTTTTSSNIVVTTPSNTITVPVNPNGGRSITNVATGGSTGEIHIEIH